MYFGSCALMVYLSFWILFAVWLFVIELILIMFNVHFGLVIRSCLWFWCCVCLTWVCCWCLFGLCLQSILGWFAFLGWFLRCLVGFCYLDFRFLLLRAGWLVWN